MRELPIKQAFEEHYQTLTNFTAYQKAIEEFPKKSIRVNTLKATVRNVKKSLEAQGWTLEPVPWCQEGFYVSHNEQGDMSSTVEHQSGEVFIQRSVSMFPAIVLDPKPGEIVLDMCAAPGAKTTHLAALMKNEGLIVANENSTSRLKSLYANLQRCSVVNTVVVQHSGDKLPYIGLLFDKILLDVPCSGTGLIKGHTERTMRTLKTWNVHMVRRLAQLQKKLLLAAIHLLKKDGTLVYSTCSLEPDEDEHVVSFALNYGGVVLEDIRMPIKSEHQQGIKIWPQHQNTEGFFVAKLRKT